MNPIILGAAVGFVIGLAGFIIVQFWLRPIAGYRKIKKEIRALLPALTEEEGFGEETRGALRRLAERLTKAHADHIPGWYRIRLRSVGESPEEACGHLMALANIRTREHARSRVDKLKGSLNIE